MGPLPTTDLLLARHKLLQGMRSFFTGRGFLEVETPYLLRFPAPEAHIDPLTVFAGQEGPFYLHTSPEMGMKKLYAVAAGPIFQICKVFRVEEYREVHDREFTMLEWYAPGPCAGAMALLTELVGSLLDPLAVPDPGRFCPPWAEFTMRELFEKELSLNPFALTADELRRALRLHGFGSAAEDDSWTELFFKALIERIEPSVKGEAPCFITGWPSAISSMARRQDDGTVERFELYVDGLEIANGYTELLDAEEQRERFMEDNRERIAMGKEAFAVDGEFLDVLPAIRGPVAGVSVGVDRLLMALLGKRTIGEVLPLRVIP